MTDVTSVFASYIAAGDTVERALAKLRQYEGAHPVTAIKAIRTVTGVSLAEAKQIFDSSPTWRQAVLANRVLHEEAIAALIGSSES
jgi:ribosomal protein L7/L12